MESSRLPSGAVGKVTLSNSSLTAGTGGTGGPLGAHVRLRPKWRKADCRLGGATLPGEQLERPWVGLSLAGLRKDTKTGVAGLQ